MIKITLSVILFACLIACTRSQKPFSNIEQTTPSVKKYPGYISSIRLNKDEIIINPMVILNNKNLPPFVDDLKNTSLTMSYKLGGTPPFIMSFLKRLSGDNFSIANPGKDWNCCCDRDDNLPNRELICRGENKNLFVLSYHTGGIGVAGHVILIRYHDKIITDFWTGLTLTDIDSKDEILKYLISNKTEHSGAMNI